jgi:hypothetical protein
VLDIRMQGHVIKLLPPPLMPGHSPLIRPRELNRGGVFFGGKSGKEYGASSRKGKDGELVRVGRVQWKGEGCECAGKHSHEGGAHGDDGGAVLSGNE